MELLCTAKTAVDNGETVECSVFMLRDWQLQPGDKIEQRRDTGQALETVATWEFVSQTPNKLILKRVILGAETIEMADGFYVVPPVEDKPVVAGLPSTPVLVFGGKNWKLASPKKWVPATLVIDGYPSVGELNIGGKDYEVLKLNEGFAARLKAAS